METHGHRRVRRIVAATATVGALGVGALTGATGASAADVLSVGAMEYHLTVPSGVTDPAGAGQLHLRVTHEDAGDLAPATVTVDASGPRLDPGPRGRTPPRPGPGPAPARPLRAAAPPGP